MALRQRNLLEAFRNAGQAGSSDESSSSGPFATPPPGRENAGGTPRPPRGRGRSAVLPPWLPVALLVGVAFVLGYALGRGTKGGEEAEAAGRKTPSESTTSTDPAGIRPSTDGPGTTIPAAPPSTDPGEDRPDTTAPKPTDPLRDPANRYTIQVVTYGGDQGDYARATQKLLADLELPVFPPVVRGSHLEILVGAAPTSGELTDLRDRIRELTANGRRRAFGDALIVRIDDHVDR